MAAVKYPIIMRETITHSQQFSEKKSVWISNANIDDLRFLDKGSIEAHKNQFADVVHKKIPLFTHCQIANKF